MPLTPRKAYLALFAIAQLSMYSAAAEDIGAPGTPSAAQLAPNPTSIENQKPGTSAWQLSSPALARQIEGYASRTSVARGGSIDLHVSTSAATYSIDIYRMGYYGGMGARHVRSYGNLSGLLQSAACVNPSGVIECNWPVAVTVDIPAGGDPASLAYWASGVYLAKLTASGPGAKDSYIIFVVRDDARTATYIGQLPVTTYQAYNYWGGKSLYTGCFNHASNWSCSDGAQKATAVSFNRPYTPSSNPQAAYGAGAGEFITNVQTVAEGYPISSAGFDYNFVRWIEKEGYDIKYISNIDLHQTSGILNTAKAFIGFGHDEYYSWPMYNNLLAQRAAGRNLAFFSSNEIYWQVRFAAGSYGSARADRIMICYKDGNDPVQETTLTTGQFRLLGRPEAALVGVQYVADPVTADVQVSNPHHWLYDGSGATEQTILRGLLGYEIDAIAPGVSPPNTVSLAHSVVNELSSDMVYYPASSGAQVFATGTMQWAWGLDGYFANQLREDYASPIAQKLTANVFAALADADLFVLRGASNGRYLATDASGMDAGALVESANASAGPRAAQWRILADGDGPYARLVSRRTGLCVDAYGTANGAPVGTWECHGEDNQQWSLLERGNGYVSIVDGRSSRCIGRGGSGQISLAACAATPEQLWWKVGIGGDGQMPPLPNQPGLPAVPIVLSTPGAATAMGVAGPAAGLATVKAPGSQTDATVQWRPQATGLQNQFSLRSLSNSLCLDAYGQGNDTDVGTWACHGMDNQLWNFSANPDGTYTINNKRSPLCLTRRSTSGQGANSVSIANCNFGAAQRWQVANAVVASTPSSTFQGGPAALYMAVFDGDVEGAQIIQAASPAAPAARHLWQVDSSGGGDYVRLVSKANGLCADAYGAEDGAVFGTWECHGEDNQQWQLTEFSGKIYIKNRYSSHCVQRSANDAPGDGLVLRACTFQPEQLWDRIVE